MFHKVKDLNAICTKTQLQVGRAGNTQRPKSVAQWSVVDVQVPQGVNAYRWVEKYSEYNWENCKEMMSLSTSMGEVWILTFHRSGWGGTVGIFITCTAKPSLNRFESDALWPFIWLSCLCTDRHLTSIWDKRFSPLLICTSSQNLALSIHRK